MSYEILYADKFYEDIKKLQKSGQKKLVNKIADLIRELKISPREGIGKPEELVGYGNRAVWSRRVDKKHRLVYEIFDDKIEIIVLSAYGHYDDK